MWHMFNGLFSKTTWVSRYLKGKPVWILMTQEMMGFCDAVASAGPHTHTRLTALFPELPRWKVKPIWILLKQQTVSSSGISWAICKSAPHSRQITTPAPQFFTGGSPTNSIKALRATYGKQDRINMQNIYKYNTINAQHRKLCKYHGWN